MIAAGSANSIAFELKWSPKSGSSAADVTRGRLRVSLAGSSVWGGDQGIEWTWVELLEHFARFWPDLILEEGDPLGLNVPIETLRAAAGVRWLALTEQQHEQEEETLWAYLEAHDLAAGLQGVFPSALFVTREGNGIRFASRDTVVLVEAQQAETTLQRLGDAIATRLELAQDERAKRARELWSERENVDPGRFTRLLTGLSDEELGDLPPIQHAKLLVPDFRSARQPTELLAVARMSAGALSSKDRSEVLEWVIAAPQIWTQPIERLSAETASMLSGLADHPPHQQGVEVARWFRGQFRHPNERFEPEHLLRNDWKVSIIERKLGTGHVDAICSWGPKHGPAILLNRTSRRARLLGRRATLAHEIGHLLMDRDKALPLGEVLGGRLPVSVEQRAKAFAAELLIPQSVACQAILDADDVVLAADVLSGHFGASREIVAWQARNGCSNSLPTRKHNVLRQFVSDPERF